MTHLISVVIEKDIDGYCAYPEFPGYQTQGDSLNEAKPTIQEATELYLETLSDQEKQHSLNGN